MPRHIFLLCFMLPVVMLGANAPNVTNIAAINHNGQTFITWTDPVTGSGGEIYRYNIYRSTSCPISSLGSAVEIQSGVLNNSGQRTLAGLSNYTQAQRVNVSNPMSIITNGGSALATWTGLATYTNLATATACYAVITHDTTLVQTDSPISAGNNSMSGTIGEAVAPIAPVRQIACSPGAYCFDGTPNLPLWIYLHASSGNGVPGVGDLWQFSGDSTMGFQDGILNLFTIYDDNQVVYHYGQQTITMDPQADFWTIDGTTGLESFWFGYEDNTGFAQPYWESQLLWQIGFAESQYASQVDTNHVYGDGQSMGAWGNASFSTRHPEIYAAIFFDEPRWECCASSTGISDAVSNSIISGVGLKMPDNATLYSDYYNTMSYVSSCTHKLPALIWGVGRQDTISIWGDQVTMANALKTCHYGFSFQWSNNNHGGGNEYSINKPQYQVSSYAKNVPYPAFTNFSLDNNYGNGNPANGDLTGCVNCGWNWKSVTGTNWSTTETSKTWASCVSNSQVTTTATTDITAQNTQLFKPQAGRTVNYKVTSGTCGGTQSNISNGSVTVDQYGLVTLTSVTLTTTPTTVTFSIPPAATWEDWSCATGTAAWDGVHTVITCPEASPFQTGQYITIRGATGSWAPLNTQHWFSLRWDVDSIQTVWKVSRTDLEPGLYIAPSYTSASVIPSPPTETISLTSSDATNMEVTVVRGASSTTPKGYLHSQGSGDYWIGPTTRQIEWCVTVIDSTHIWLATPTSSDFGACNGTLLDSSTFGAFTGQIISIQHSSDYLGPADILQDYTGGSGNYFASTTGIASGVSTKKLNVVIPGCANTSDINLCSQQIGTPSTPAGPVRFPDLNASSGVSSLVVNGSHVGTVTFNSGGFTYTYNPPMIMIAPNQVVWLYNMTEPSFGAINVPWVIQSVTPAPITLTNIVVTGNTGSGGTATVNCNSSCGVTIGTNVMVCCFVQASFLAGYNLVTATPTSNSYQFSSDPTVPNGTYVGLTGMFYEAPSDPTSFTINMPLLAPGTYNAATTVGCGGGGLGSTTTCQMFLGGPNYGYNYFDGSNNNYTQGGFMLGAKESRAPANTNANRFRIWGISGKTFPTPHLGKYSFQWGNYYDDGHGSDHFYHAPNIPATAGNWIQFEYNTIPEYSVSGVVKYIPEDPTFVGYISDSAWKGGIRHYLDAMYKWYLEVGVAGVNAAGQTFSYGKMETEYVTSEPDEYFIVGVTSSYNSACGCYMLGWNHPAEVGTPVSPTYEVRYSTSGSIKTLGWSSATVDGITTPYNQSSPYSDINYATGAIASANSIWFGVRPTMPIYNTVQGLLSTAWITFDRDPNMSVGDYITTSGITCASGSCGAFNQTQIPIKAIQPRQLWSLFLPSSGYTTAGQLTNIACSGGSCTVNMNGINHNLVPGMAVQIFGTPAGGPSVGATFTRYIVTSTPTTQSFTISCGGCANATFTTDYSSSVHLQMYSLPAIAISAAGGGVANLATGSMVSTENNKNFLGVSFSPPQSGPIVTVGGFIGGGVRK